MKCFINSLDILNKKPSLYINSRSRYVSNLGVILGIITIVSVTSLTLYFISDYFNKSEVNVLVNNLSGIYPIYNMTNMPFMFSLQTVNGEVLKSEIIKFSPQLFTFLPENNGKPVIKILEYEKCDLNRDFGNFSFLFAEYKNLESYYCLKPGVFNTTLFGAFGDLSRGYSYLNLYLNRCRNNSIYNHLNIKC